MATRRQLWSLTPQQPAAATVPREQAREQDVGTLTMVALGAGLAARSANAAEPEPLDEEFLEYLSQLEGEQEDWTLFEGDADKAAPAKPVAAKPAPSRPLPAKPTPVNPAASKASPEVKR